MNTAIIHIDPNRYLYDFCLPFFFVVSFLSRANLGTRTTERERTDG